MKKWLVGVLISGIAVYFLSQNFNINEFERLNGKINWYILPLLFLSNLWAFVPFSIRWYYLLEKKISFRQSLTTSMIGVGLNMILPARGGDVVRLLMNKKDSELPLTHLFSRIFLEKVMDLAAVVLLGAVALFTMGLGQTKNLSLLFVSTAVIISMFVGLGIIKYALEPLRSFFQFLFGLIKKRSLYEEKFDHHLIEFSNFLKGDKLRIPVLYSIPTWVFGYAISYYLAGVLIGMPIRFPETLLFMFLGGLGVAIPSAPSGIGVFHAALISGFLILGRDPGEGLVYATVVHLSQFLITTTLAAVAYLDWKVFQKQEH
ncbi:MAG: lysylphosphatidylglycerol synthase transmembrane domain-containing protein [Leptospira sp.]|nr:lysylphosphatidylglycerol synthase transmembrane domain-containing protein [Leptospira sp.]